MLRSTRASRALPLVAGARYAGLAAWEKAPMIRLLFAA